MIVYNLIHRIVIASVWPDDNSHFSYVAIALHYAGEY